MFFKRVPISPRIVQKAFLDASLAIPIEECVDKGGGSRTIMATRSTSNEGMGGPGQTGRVTVVRSKTMKKWKIEGGVHLGALGDFGRYLFKRTRGSRTRFLE